MVARTQLGELSISLQGGRKQVWNPASLSRNFVSMPDHVINVAFARVVDGMGSRGWNCRIQIVGMGEC